MNEIDYKELLSKYILYIRDVEGADYILDHDERKMSDVKFSPEEWEALKEMAKKQVYGK